MDHKKEGFSYVSPELQRKDALKAFGVELIIIVIVVIGIFFALNYFGILPFSRILNNMFSNQDNTTSKIPQKAYIINPNEPAQTPVVTPVVYDANAKPSVEVVSDMPGYKITLQNQDKLISLLNSWNVYNRNYISVYGAEGSTISYPLKTIIVHLTDTAQGTNNFGYDATHIYSSSLTKITPEKFDMYIFLDSNILSGKNSNLQPDKVMQSTFLASLYGIVYPSKNSQEASNNQNNLYKSYNDNPLMRVLYFKIEAK